MAPKIDCKWCEISSIQPNIASHLSLQSSLYKCYPYKHYKFIYVKEVLLPYKNTIGKTSECQVLSVIACSTALFVNCTFVSFYFEKMKVIIYKRIHFKHVFTFIPYSLRTSQILFFGDPYSLCIFKQFGRGDGKQRRFGSWGACWVLVCQLGLTILDIASFRRSNQGQQSGGHMSCMEFFPFLFFSFILRKLQVGCQSISFGSIQGELEFYFIFPPINCIFCNCKQIHLLFNHASTMGPDFSFSFLISQKNCNFHDCRQGMEPIFLNSFFSHNVVNINFQDF